MKYIFIPDHREYICGAESITIAEKEMNKYLLEAYENGSILKYGGNYGYIDEELDNV